MPSDRPRAGFQTLLCTAVPALATATMVAIWGVDVPFWDQWVLVAHLESVAAGHWPWAELWRPHNEHRLFFPQLLMLVTAQLTAWNIRVELALNLMLAAATLCTLWWLVRQTVDRPPKWLMPVFSLLVFNPSQWENWLWGWQLQIFINVLMVTLGMALLTRPQQPLRWVAAVLCGIVASFSFANGLLFWPLALPLILRSGERRSGRVVLWLAVSLLVTVAYVHGLELTGDRPPLFQEGLARTLKLLGGYLSIYLSAPLFGFHGHTALYGGFSVLAACSLYLAKEAASHKPTKPAWLLGPRLPWILLAGYAVSSAGLTAVGRLHLSLGQALTSRYITISSLLWLAMLVLLAAWPKTDLPNDSPTKSRLHRAAIPALVIMLLANAGYGTSRMIEAFHDRSKARAALLSTAPRDDIESVTKVYPDPELVLIWAESLDRLDMGPFRSRSAPPTP